MSDKKYAVLIENEVIASNMDINNALIFIKALFDHYYEEHSMVISIKEMEKIGINNGNV